MRLNSKFSASITHNVSQSNTHNIHAALAQCIVLTHLVNVLNITIAISIIIDEDQPRKCAKEPKEACCGPCGAI